MKNYIIPIFIPHYGCRHACVFCNQHKITGLDMPVPPQAVDDMIARHLTMITAKRHIEVAFYGGSFTALPLECQQALLEPARQALLAGKINGIRLSTRPDCIDAQTVAFLKVSGVSIIELGVQSLDDVVLVQTGRGHAARHAVAALAFIREQQLGCGFQLMPGLPGEDFNSLVGTVQQVVSLRPDFVRIYPTLVIVDTKLAQLYTQGTYRPLTMDQAVQRSAYMKLVFERSGIQVIRTGLQASPELADPNTVLAGPYHPSFGEMVDSHLFYCMMVQGLNAIACREDSVTIHHHPQDASKVRGLRNCNTQKLKNMFQLRNILFVQDGFQQKQISIEQKHYAGQYIINQWMLAEV